MTDKNKEELVSKNTNSIYNFGSLVELAKYFIIPLDEDRLADYEIIKIEMNPPYLKIFDKKTKTEYTSCYTSECEATGYVANERINFISVVALSPMIKRKWVYNIFNRELVLEKILFEKDTYKLEFRRTLPGFIDGYYILEYASMRIIYSKKDTDKWLPLLFLEYNDNYTCLENFQYYKVMQNYLDYTNPTNLEIRREFGTNNFIHTSWRCRIPIEPSKEGNYMDLEGACFEKIDETSFKRTKLNDPSTCLKDYDNLDLNSSHSLLLFAGKSQQILSDAEAKERPKSINLTYYGENRNVYQKYYDFTITKEPNEFKVKYYHHPVKPRVNRFAFEPLFKDEFVIPSLNEGLISLDELSLIIKTIENKYPDDLFIQYILEEIRRFKTSLEIKKGKTLEIHQALSPKIFAVKEFADIAKEVGENLDFYHNVAEEMVASLKASPKERIRKKK